MVRNWTEIGKDDLLNAISLSNRKGLLINFGTWAFVFIVGALEVANEWQMRGRGGRRTQGRGMGRWLDSERAPKKKRG